MTLSSSYVIFIYKENNNVPWNGFWHLEFAIRKFVGCLLNSEPTDA